ncbi:MAG: 4Fe-4S binding protein [Candidatus Thermoplasmatota archaeon]
MAKSAARDERNSKDAAKAKAAAADPDRPGEKCKAPAATWVPVVNRSKCEGHGDCVSVCPYDVFEVQRIKPEDYKPLGFIAKLKVTAHGKKQAYLPNSDQCKACGLCVVACPEDALTLQRL